MNNRLILILLSLLITLSLFTTGCGMPGSQSGGVYEEGVLRVWTTWGDDPAQLQSLFDRYSQVGGLPVRVTNGFDSDQIYKALTGATPPDMIILSSSDLVRLYHEQGLIEPLSTWAEATAIDLADIYPAALAQCKLPGGETVCLPWGGDIDALFWNKDLFKAAGLDPEQPPQTMEALAEFAAKLTLVNENGKLSQAGFIPDFFRSHTDLYAHMFGGYWTDEQVAEPSLTSRPLVEAVNWQNQFYNQYGIQEIRKFSLSFNIYMNSHHPFYAGKRLNCQQCHRNIPRKSDKIPDHGFYNGQVAMLVDAQWQLGENYIAKLKPDLNYGVAPFPPPAAHPERANTSVVQGAVVILPAGGLDKQAAANLLAWMMSPEILAEGAFANASLPTSHAAAQDPRFWQIPNYSVFLDLLAHPNCAHNISRPVNPELNQALHEVEEQLFRKNGGDPATILNEIQAKFAPLLGQ